MKEFSVGRKFGAYAVLAAGIILLVVALIMDMSGSESVVRGPMLVAGMLGTIAGIYLFPTLKHHRVLVYVIFLFPLLFTFLITVIIPMIEGICYSFTDWDGITVTGFVGVANYSKMFGQPSFIWSILITFIFVSS